VTVRGSHRLRIAKAMVKRGKIEYYRLDTIAIAILTKIRCSYIWMGEDKGAALLGRKIV
jgi:hypothetical protein